MSAVAALAVASPFAYVAVCDLDAQPAPEHHEFVRAANMTDLPNELISALSQGLSQFGVNLPPVPSLTGTGGPAMTSPGLTGPGLTSPGLPGYTTPGATPGFTTPGATPGFTTPGATPGFTTPGATPGFTTPGATPGFTTPGATPGLTPGATPGLTPGATPGLTPPGTTPGLPGTAPSLTDPGQIDPSLLSPDGTLPGAASPAGIDPSLTSPAANGATLPAPGEIPISAPIGLDPGAGGTYPILGDPSLGAAPAATSGGSGGLVNDLMNTANQLGASQAMDLLKGVLMPSIMQAVHGANPAAAAAAPAPAVPVLPVPPVPTP